MQFNMQFGQIWDDLDPDHAPIRIGATIDEIRRHSPDIVLLQEVEHAVSKGTHSPFPPNYTHLRSQLSGYDSAFCLPARDPRELPFGIGLAIFSRTQLHGFKRWELESPNIPFQFNGRETTPTKRLLIGAATFIQGRELQLFNVHLLAHFMLTEDSDENPAQRERVIEVLRQAQGPTLIGGDFNVSRHRILVDQFASRGYRTVQEQEPTWRRRPLVLDHIFHNAGLFCRSHSVHPTKASDHHVLLADFDFA